MNLYSLKIWVVLVFIWLEVVFLKYVWGFFW